MTSTLKPEAELALYRWFGGAYIVAALLFAAGEHRGALREAAQQG